MATKMDILRDELVTAEAKALALREQIDGLAATPCGLSCACGKVLDTEADFASHFVLPQSSIWHRWLNLGECPNSEKGKAIIENTRNYTANLVF